MGSAGVEPLMLENEILSKILQRYYERYNSDIKFIISPEAVIYKSCEKGLKQETLSLKISLISKTGVLSEEIPNYNDEVQIFDIEEVKLRLCQKIDLLL